MLQDLLDFADVSFKWILLSFNFITILFVYIHKRRNKKPREHHILFVIAHPDDECMFFRPTITSLQETYIIHLLCLSGEGSKRQQQLNEACKFLRIDYVSCINDQKLEDGMKEKWCEETIRKHVKEYIQNKNVKAVFTFDKGGISNHNNHKSVYFALKEWEAKENVEDCIKIYYLQTVNIVRKYSGIFEIFIAILKAYSWMDFSPFQAYVAMSKHKSQFVWYRKLWIFFSRYEYINTYQRALIKINKAD